MPQPYVLFDNVCKYYQMGDTRIAASDHVSLRSKRGSSASSSALPVRAKPPC